MKRIEIKITGVVQGVGFRPFIYLLAREHGLSGWVTNTSEGVFVEAEAEEEKLEKFLADIPLRPPPRARIEKIESREIPATGKTGFEIKASVEQEGKFILVSPDIATCGACRAEVLSETDRRYSYPFTNCTNCGPRFTIIEDIPYDRPKTTMKNFKMCPLCEKEYHDPENRRFHAQPNACPVCGPELSVYAGPLKGGLKKVETKEPVKYIAEKMLEGEIAAVKGLGGYQLACDAGNEKAVSLLRERKKRPAKPFAVMVKDVEEARELAFVSAAEEELLKSPEAPIVLLEMKSGRRLAEGIAPGNRYLGLMLPYTPLHHLLLREAGRPLVMTSGNLSEEPIAAGNEEAFERLGNIADYFLTHNRDIASRYDDSVARIFRDKTVMVRRARGYAPYPLKMPFKTGQVLAAGPELKNTFCLTREEYAFVSQHIGDLDNRETLEHYENTIELYKKLFRIKPEIIAYDLHPEYLSTKYARALEVPKKVGVQHHHAHIAACLAENGCRESVIGIAYDGTGYGPDGTLWGGELLIADMKEFRRVGHLREVLLPGGEAAIKNPYRTALSYLYETFGGELPRTALLERLKQEDINIILQQLEKKLNAPATTSCGRFFDAVSSLIGIRDRVDYEAQAAIELEMAADPDEPGSYRFEIDGKDGLVLLDTGPVIEDILEELKKKTAVSVIAGRFHNTVAELTAAACRELRDKEGLNTAALSGGVFQNSLLLEKTVTLLERDGFEVLLHRELPFNDGCISYGQAVVAACPYES